MATKRKAPEKKPAARRNVPAFCIDLGRRISTLRRKAGRTQAQLAEDVGAATSSLARIEIGQRQPSLELLGKIADSLGMPMGQLFSGWSTEIAVPEGERAWLEEMEKLGNVVKKLPAADLALLAQFAERLARDE